MPTGEDCLCSTGDQSDRDAFVADESCKTYLGLEHVSMSFGSNQVLDDVSFQVMPGETVCILGRSGVGKSVCLRILMGFLKPDAGRVIAAGEDITDYSEREIRLVDSSGYDCALSLDCGYNGLQTDRFRLKRIPIPDDASVSEMLVKTSGMWEPVRALKKRFRSRGRPESTL